MLMSRFFNLEEFEANFDVLMFLVFDRCFTSVSQVFHHCFTSVTPAHGTTAPGDNWTSQHVKSELNGIKSKVGLLC